MLDDATDFKIAQGIAPAAARTTGTVTGTAVDSAGFESVTIDICSGTITDGTHTFSLTECATVGGTYTAVVVGDLIKGTQALVDDATLKGVGCVLDTTAAHDNAGLTFGYRGIKQFIKVIATSAGTTTGGVFSASVRLGHPRHAPVA